MKMSLAPFVLPSRILSRTPITITTAKMSSSGYNLQLSGCKIVTGGTRGIGLSYSHAIAQAGANVALIFRQREDSARNAVNEIRKQHPDIKVKAYQCDVSDLQKTCEVFQAINNDEEMGKVTGLVANAGTSVVKPALELDTQDFRKVFDTNVLGVFNTCRAAAQLWNHEREKRSIVITGSISARIINQAGTNEALTQIFYNSSKAAVVNMAMGLAAEWAPKIRVNCVSPGYVETDQTDRLGRDIIEHQTKDIPLGRFAKPDEIAAQMVLLLSDRASYQTAGDYVVDGGRLAW